MIFYTAIALSVVHSIANPIHYLPFVALGKARGWNLTLTLLVAAIASAGHIVGFGIALLIGTLAGKGVSHAEHILHESSHISAILFLTLGITYTIYGIRYALTRNECKDNCSSHSCGHDHERIIRNADPHSGKYIFLLFAMFAIGPCNPILSLVAYYAATTDIGSLALLTLVYYLATAATMLACTALLYKGLEFLTPSAKFIDKWAHAISGATITISVIAAMLLHFGHH